jgi:hypothetical protein
MDPETLTYLLRGGHISMPDRIERGLWPHPPLRFSEVLAHLTILIEQNQWFPTEWSPHREGQPVNEGSTIERQAADRYVYRSARGHPTHPRQLAEVTEREFSSSTDAAAYLLKRSLHLPGDLDGWKVIE